ncbi:MAG: RnfABCDGE type electron transport complex subunit D [Lachnospiraceae bacterium]|nr:RnfABCDGE type electron transport complex subunit D [Lachnospiraceae bacterium]
MADEQKKFLNVSANPHIRDSITTQKIMLYVIIALLPATAFGIYHFGAYTIAVILTTVISSVLFEYLYEKLMKLPITVSDCSAALTGLLLALNLPPEIELWVCVVGSFVAIVIVKQLFGGLGQNFMNPALGARCFLLISFASRMTNFAYDTFSGATPLAKLKAGETVNTYYMVIGNEMGTIGEVSVIAIILGACFLILMGVIDLRIPASYIASFTVFIALFGGHGLNSYYIVGQLAGGGLMLGAFFMATDYVSSPITTKGKIIYGIFLGILTGVFRVYASGAEGVSYAIIIGNLIVPLIERWAPLKCFGYVKPEKGGK